MSQLLETLNSSQETRPRATLREVARAAGVSPATVSRALNGVGGRAVSAEKRTLILQAADELHYRPTPRLLGVPAGSTVSINNIGLVMRETCRFTDPFWSLVLEGVADEVVRQGFQSDFALFVGNPAHDHRRRLLDNRFTNGLILIGDMGLAGELSGLVAPERLVVIAGSDSTRWEADVRFDVITMEKHAALDSLVGHLVSLGRRRLGFLGPTPDQDRRGEGFVHALTRHGLPFLSGLYVECDFGVEEGYAATRTLLSRNAPGLDGLICACDTIAIGAMRAAKEFGLSLPADLAIAGFDNIPFSRDLDPPLTTVQVPKRLMGELAARRLIERIAHPEWPPIIQVVPTKLVSRLSCGERSTD